jgi:hypothetical protein
MGGSPRRAPSESTAAIAYAEQLGVDGHAGVNRVSQRW